MSEPKAVARRLTRVAPGVYRARILDERIGSESDAYLLRGESGTVLIDPLPLAPRLLRRLAPIVASVLTVGSHQRSAWRYRRRFGARVWAPRGARGLEGRPNVSFDDGDSLPGGLVARHAPGPAAAHFVLHRPGRPAIVFCGDLLTRAGRGGPAFLPDAYQDNPRQTRQSVRRVRRLRFDMLCFGHGAPLRAGARAALGALLSAERRPLRPAAAARSHPPALRPYGGGRSRTGASRRP
jgi:metallo-beta-lactamase superfamily protein